MNYLDQTDQIREYQDTVVTLRQDVPTLYKGLLMKECEVVTNKLADAKFNIPLQNVEALQSVYQVDLGGTRLRRAPTKTQQLRNTVQVLRKIVQNKQNEK